MRTASAKIHDHNDNLVLTLSCKLASVVSVKKLSVIERETMFTAMEIFKTLLGELQKQLNVENSVPTQPPTP